MYRGGVLPKSKRHHERKKRALIVYFIAGMFVAAGLIAGMWSIPRFPQFAINEVEVSGNQQVASSYIEKLVARELEGSKYIFFPKKNIFWYPEEKLMTKIASSTPRIQNVEIERGGLTTLKINISERSTYALVCTELVETSKCYLADINSVLYAEAPDFKASVFVKFYNTSTSTSLKLGDKFLEPSELKSLVGFSEKLKKINLVVARINVSSGTTELILENGGKLIVTKEQNMDIAFENLKSLIESKEFKGRNDDGLKFQYIDLRFGNKLFYKI